jgi:diphthamide synthase (EF-2-diphthine--ammonia ligase)
MTAPVRTVLSWSGGKDSALALHELLMDPAVDLRGLLTTVTDGYDRVSMHGVRTSLVAAQAAALEIPLWSVRIPPSATNEQYERAMGEMLTAIRREGIEAIAFGDLFLADVRAYRERLVAATGTASRLPALGEGDRRPRKAFRVLRIPSGGRVCRSASD